MPSNARRMVATAMLGTAMTSGMAGERYVQHPVAEFCGTYVSGCISPGDAQAEAFNLHVSMAAASVPATAP